MIRAKSTDVAVFCCQNLIAAVALSNEMTLVTNNEKHFERIPNLTIENWL